MMKTSHSLTSQRRKTQNLVKNRRKKISMPSAAHKRNCKKRDLLNWGPKIFYRNMTNTHFIFQKSRHTVALLNLLHKCVPLLNSKMPPLKSHLQNIWAISLQDVRYGIFILQSLLFLGGKFTKLYRYSTHSL